MPSWRNFNLRFHFTSQLCTKQDGSLAMCKNYAVKCHLDKNKTIRFCQHGGSKIWDINMDIDTDGPYALEKTLSIGWLDFIQDNKLKEGDVCVFETSNSQRGVTLTFHPFEGKYRAVCAPSTKKPMPGAMKSLATTSYSNHDPALLTDQEKKKKSYIHYKLFSPKSRFR